MTQPEAWDKNGDTMYYGLFCKGYGFIWVPAAQLLLFDESITRQLADLERKAPLKHSRSV